MKYVIAALSLMFSFNASAQHIGGNAGPDVVVCDQVVSIENTGGSGGMIVHLRDQLGIDFTVSSEASPVLSTMLQDAFGSQGLICVHLNGNVIMSIENR